MARLNDTKALASRDPANNPRTKAGMTLEYGQESSTYHVSQDRQGMSLATTNGNRFGNKTAECNDCQGDVNKAINGER
jgi:hypothetical protein